MSETTAMIDVTATMFPSTVRNDRSLFDQMAASARPNDSSSWCMTRQRLRYRAGVSILTRSPSSS